MSSSTKPSSPPSTERALTPEEKTLVRFLETLTNDASDAKSLIDRWGTTVVQYSEFSLNDFVVNGQIDYNLAMMMSGPLRSWMWTGFAFGWFAHNEEIKRKINERRTR